MLKFYYNPAYKYTNRTIIDVSGDNNFTQKDYENIDSPDTINGHIIYTLGESETIPTYVVDTVSGWKWFVSGITQKRTGKYQISLLRDIISESPDTWKQEQAYITAGTATNYNKYKRWNLPYTNTKVLEKRLNFGGKSSFFVFYVNEQQFNGGVVSESDLEIKYSSIPGITGYDYTVEDLSEIPNYNLIGAGDMSYWSRHRAKIRTAMFSNFVAINQIGDAGLYVCESDTLNGFNITNSQVSNGYYDYNRIFINTNYNQLNANANNSKTDFHDAIQNFLATYESSLGPTITDSQKTSLDTYVGKIIFDSTANKVYTVQKYMQYDPQNTNITSATLQSALRNINFPMGSTNATVLLDDFKTRGNWINFLSEREIISYEFVELGTSNSFDFNFIANTRKLSKSAVRCVNIVSDDNHSDEEIAQCLMLAQTNGINPDNTVGKILDIQYLPFSIASTTNNNFKINADPIIAEFLESDDFNYFTNLSDLTDINKETDTIKIVSPSRGSQYLFRPYDNDGNMEFATKITIRPYTSTIYVRPSTVGLLVNEWDDKDCLIIQEDFSLTNVSSEWTQYIYNNKTYLNTFERQMQGREYERSWERQVEQAQAKSDDWNARNISAQKARTYTGNIPIISGIAAAIGTAWQDQDYMAAAQLDREYNEALYQEGMSLSRDLFEYQLENIKSQPLIPSKVTTIDCKFLDGVYLEYYSTNDTELNAIRNFYRYNGNRIDDYGTFSDYWGNFIKGKIIISQNYTQPEIDELNRRLSMGIFTGGAL